MDLSVGAVRAHIFLGGNERGGPPPLSRSRFSRLTITSNRASFPLLAFFIMAFLGSDRASFVHVNLGGPLIAFVHVNLGHPSIAWLGSCERAEAPLL